jgi:hypothetical protein
MSEVDILIKSMLGARRDAKMAEMKALEEKIQKKIGASKPVQQKHKALCAQRQKLTKYLDFHKTVLNRLRFSISEERRKFVDESCKMLNVREDPSFVCPLTLDVMEHPVIDITHGKSYDRKAIMKWIGEKRTSPITGKRLNVKCLVPNRDLKDAIESYKKSKSTILSEFELLSKGVTVGIREMLLTVYKNSSSMQGYIKKCIFLRNFENKKCIPLQVEAQDKISKMWSEIDSCAIEILAKRCKISSLKEEKTKLGRFFKRLNDTEKTAKNAVDWMKFATGGLYVPTRENIPDTVVKYLTLIAGGEMELSSDCTNRQVQIQVARMKLGMHFNRREIAKELEVIGFDPVKSGGLNNGSGFGKHGNNTFSTSFVNGSNTSGGMGSMGSGISSKQSSNVPDTKNTILQFSEIGYSLEDLKKLGFDYSSMLDAGFSKVSLMDAGWSHSELSGNPPSRAFHFSPTTDTDNRASEGCFGSTSPGEMFVFGTTPLVSIKDDSNDV